MTERTACDRLRRIIDDDDDYRRLIDIQQRALQESALSPIKLRVLGVYDVNFLLRLFHRVTEKCADAK